MLRILYFYRGFVQSTQRIHIDAMIDAWRGQGHQVFECFPLSRDGNGGATVASSVKRLPQLCRNAAQALADRTASKALSRACGEFQPDFIYERYALFSKCGVDIAQCERLPLIMEVNSAVAHLEPEQISAILRPWGRKREWAILSAADAIFTVSKAQAERLAALGLPADRLHVTHNAVDPSAFMDLAGHRQAMRSRLGITDECALLLLHPWNHHKATEGILSIMSSVASTMGDSATSIVLISVGGGPILAEAQDKLQRWFPRARFVGALPHEQVYSYLAAADVGLIPWHEAFTSPLKLFEYMGAGLAIVAPNLSGIAEVLRDGENGLMFPPGDGRAMADAILRLCRDEGLRRRLGEEARRNALERYTWRNNAEQVVQVALKLRERIGAR